MNVFYMYIFYYIYLHIVTRVHINMRIIALHSIQKHKRKLEKNNGGEMGEGW